MKVLILESHHEITQQLSDYLNQCGLYDLTICHNDTNLNFKESHDYNLIFIDYAMQHDDPFEVAYQLKNANPDTYIVFLTRFKNNEAEVFENLDIEYILKPINIYRLKTVIQKAKHYKYKPTERFIGDVSIKMFGSMEVKMNSRNVRFMRRRHKEILAYLILHNFKASAHEMAQAIMADHEYLFVIHELKALIFELRKDIELVDRYIQIEYVDFEYHLRLNNVAIDYINFMKMEAEKLSMHRLEMSLLTYGKGLLYNFSNDWFDVKAYEAKKHFFNLQHSLIHQLEERNDADKLRNILFNLKQYLETEEDWDYFNHVVRHNFPKVKQEHFIVTD